MSEFSENTKFSRDSYQEKGAAAAAAGAARCGSAGGTCSGTVAPALGIYAKTAAIVDFKGKNIWGVFDKETGEIVRLERSEDGYKVASDAQTLRAERFALKSVVNGFLPRSRTAKCMCWRVPRQDLRVMRSIEHKKAFYAGLQVCASVWACPVCAAKITERRRVELVGAVATARAMGMAVYLLTLTVPHGLGDDLGAMLDKMMTAWRKTTSDRVGKTIRGIIGLEGTVRALEVTDGKNGFHPHFHVLLFLNPDFSTDFVQQAFTGLWINACVKSGLPAPSIKYGVKVDNGDYAARYASKWGIESEITKGHVKQGKEDSKTPWDHLRCYLQTKCTRARARFLIYIEAFTGRRQLYWSNGLKFKLGVGEISDEDLAVIEDDQAIILASLTDEDWRAVLASKSEAVVLQIAENNPEFLTEFLEKLRLNFQGTDKK
jgi:hypothetical protein